MGDILIVKTDDSIKVKIAGSHIPAEDENGHTVISCPNLHLAPSKLFIMNPALSLTEIEKPLHTMMSAAWR